LALALGIGAAVASGAGTAHAEPSTDQGASGSVEQASRDVSTGPREKAGAPSGAPDVKARPRNSSHTPASQLGGVHDIDHSGSRPKSLADIQQKISSTTPTPRSPRKRPEPGIAPIKPNPPAAVRIATRPPKPVAPVPQVQAGLQLLRRELEPVAPSVSQKWLAATAKSLRRNRVSSTAPSAPTPADDAATAYGDIGKWMLQSDGQVSNWGGLPYNGKTLLESVNIIIVDPKSGSAAESAQRLHTAMFWSGFPAQPFHSTGFRSTIDDVTYGQQPTGLLLGFSDNFFILPNDHGRIFGPDPVETSTGYVWSGAFSAEQFVVYDLLPRHGYVSSNTARNALAMQLIASGRATYGGMVPLNNSYNTATTTTGDHDGYAAVVILT
jgi:hypothetical protein